MRLPSLAIAVFAIVLSRVELVAQNCPRKRGTLSVIDSSALRQMTGTFSLTLVVTSFNDPDWTPIRYSLALRSPDSTEAATARLRTIGHMPRHSLLLLGTAQMTHEGRLFSEMVELDSGIVYMGCRECYDGNPWHLRVTAIDAKGFYGTWRDYQSGIDVVVDRRGRRLPDPAGHFCAIRTVP